MRFALLNGTTQNKWDVVIPFDKLWNQYNRIIKDNGVIALFCDGLFQAKLILSNESNWKYNLVWNKILSTGFLNANRMPLRSHEEISIFYKNQCTYNPQMTKGKPLHGKGTNKNVENFNCYGRYNFVDNAGSTDKFPVSILDFQKPHPSKCVHPTEKPIALLEYLIKTYTNENETVLDNCMGSGSTGVACKFTNRNFIGIEKDDKYFEIAKHRISNPETFCKLKDDKISKYDLF